MAIFKEQGDPMIVARRYRQSSRSLTIGWELPSAPNSSDVSDHPVVQSLHRGSD